VTTPSFLAIKQSAEYILQTSNLISLSSKKRKTSPAQNASNERNSGVGEWLGECQ